MRTVLFTTIHKRIGDDFYGYSSLYNELALYFNCEQSALWPNVNWFLGHSREFPPLNFSFSNIQIQIHILWDVVNKIHEYFNGILLIALLIWDFLNANSLKSWLIKRTFVQIIYLSGFESKNILFADKFLECFFDHFNGDTQIYHYKLLK